MKVKRLINNKTNKTNIILLILTVVIVLIAVLAVTCTKLFVSNLDSVNNVSKIASNKQSSIDTKHISSKEASNVEAALYKKYHELFVVDKKRTFKKIEDYAIEENIYCYKAHPYNNQNITFNVNVYKDKQNEFEDDYALSKELYKTKQIKDTLVNTYSTSVEKYITNQLSSLNVPCYVRVLPIFDVGLKYIDKTSLKEVKDYRDTDCISLTAEEWYDIARLKYKNIVEVMNFTKNSKPKSFEIFVAINNDEGIVDVDALYKQIQKIASEKYAIKEVVNYNTSNFIGKKCAPFTMYGSLYDNTKSYNNQIKDLKALRRDRWAQIGTIYLYDDIYKENQPDQTFEISADENGKLDKNENNLVKKHNYVKN